MAGKGKGLAIIFALIFCCSEAAPQSQSSTTTLPPKEEHRDITFEALNASLDTLNIIDIRRRDELKDTGKIPNSKNLPLQELEKALLLEDAEFEAKYGFPKLSPDDPTLVITCRSGRRVRFANTILKEKGFNKHKIYYGSFLDWKNRGGRIISV